MPDIAGTLKPPRLSTPPSSPALGQMYYDTGSNLLKWWDGTSWVTASGSGSTIYDSDPIGTIKAYSGQTVPTNWAIADGRTLDKTVYPELFNAIGYIYGGSGNNFNLPDLRGKFLYGSSSATLADLGTTGGEATHVLTAGEMPSHGHTGSADTVGNIGGTALSAGDHFHTPTVPTDAFMLN